MYYTTELYHHGIQGQKWGIRRYQNEDGTLTAEGRKRYGYGENEKYYTDANGRIIPKKDVSRYKGQMSRHDRREIRQLKRDYKSDGTPTLRKKFKDRMSYTDENGKRHLTKDGKAALGVAAGFIGTSALAGTMIGTRIYDKRKADKKLMDHARRVFDSFSDKSVGDFTPAVVSKGKRLTMKRILLLGQKKFKWE